MVTKVPVKAGPEIKSFGGGPRKPSELREFELIAYLDDEPVPLRFTIRVGRTSGDLIQILKLQASNAEGQEMVPVMMRSLRKMMVDNDGVSVRWSLKDSVIKPKKKDDLPDGFRGPDGKIYELTDTEVIEKFQKVENGSSRRRWSYLMEEEDDLSIEAEDLIDVVQWAISESSGHLT